MSAKKWNLFLLKGLKYWQSICNLKCQKWPKLYLFFKTNFCKYFTLFCVWDFDLIFQFSMHLFIVIRFQKLLFVSNCELRTRVPVIPSKQCNQFWFGFIWNLLLKEKILINKSNYQNFWIIFSVKYWFSLLVDRYNPLYMNTLNIFFAQE